MPQALFTYERPGSGLSHLTVTTPGLASAVAAPLTGGTLPCRAVRIQADSTNSGTVLIGFGSAISSTDYGASLAAGKKLAIAIDDLNKVWWTSTSAGDIVHCLLITAGS